MAPTMRFAGTAPWKLGDRPTNIVMANHHVSNRIICTTTPFGYEILISRGTRIIHDHSAGNCAHDSVQVVPLNDPACLSLNELKELAHRTARDIADEYGISHDHIEFN